MFEDRSNLKIAIANATPFYRSQTGTWFPAAEWLSLQQWFDFLDNIILLKPEITAEKPPKGWVKIPTDITVRRLCNYSDPYPKRRGETLKSANEFLNHRHLLYARMPNYEAYWCYKLAKKKGIPLLLELHGDWETAILQEDTRTIFRRITRRYRASAARKAVSEMAKSAICVLAVGPHLLDKYVPRTVTSLVSTNNLLSERYYSRRKNFSLKDPPFIFFAGCIQRRKGLHILFKALANLKRSGRCFQMVLAGSGPMVKELTAYASRHGFAQSVQFVGQAMYGEELFDYYRNADIFVLPSIAAEGVPRVTHEAMAFGCPVIATDIGSVAWQLQGGAGIVVEPGSADNLAAAIVEVLDNIDTRRSLSENGCRRSLEFTLEKQQAKIADFVIAQLDKFTTVKNFSRPLYPVER